MEESIKLFDGSQILQELSAVGDEKLQTLFNHTGLASPAHEAEAAQCQAAALSLASSAMCGLQLPSRILEPALVAAKFPSDPTSAMDQALFCSKLRDLLASIADVLREKPLAATILDGTSIKLLLEDEDDFAWLAENLFTGLDVEDTGKISHSGLRTALLQMGSDMGVPAPSDGKEAEMLISSVLEKHKAVGDIGQAQFAKLLQEILEDLADHLALRPLAMTLKLNVNNGSELRKVLADAELYSKISNMIFDELDSSKNGRLSKIELRQALESHAKEWGLPGRDTNEHVAQLYDDLLSASDCDNSGEIDKKEFQSLLREILEVFAGKLETKPLIL